MLENIHIVDTIKNPLNINYHIFSYDIQILPFPTNECIMNALPLTIECQLYTKLDTIINNTYPEQYRIQHN